MNERVEDHQCVPCGEDLTNSPGDDASGLDTTCDDACGETFDIQCDEHFEAYIKAEESLIGFGARVDIDGDTAVVRGRGVHVYRRRGSTWTHETTLRPPPMGTDPPPTAFGDSGIAIHGDTIAIGQDAPDEYVYVFDRLPSNEWVHSSTLQASNNSSGDRFGRFLDLEGSLLVVGAGGEDSASTGVDGDESNNSAPDSGAAYVFRRSGDTWEQEAYLKASNTMEGAGLARVAVSGGTIAIGAPGESSANGGINPPANAGAEAEASGAVYIFRFDNGAWTQEAHIKSDTPRDWALFGEALAIDGDTLVVGVGTDNEYSGRLYVFQREAGAWTQNSVVDFSGAGSAGSQVDIHDGVVAAGAPFLRLAEPGPLGNPYDASYPVLVAGGVFLLERTPTGWVEKATVTAPYPQPEDQFFHVALSGGRLIVGAPKEDAAALGIDGDPTDTTAPDSGAAYIYRIAP